MLVKKSGTVTALFIIQTQKDTSLGAYYGTTSI